MLQGEFRMTGSGPAVFGAAIPSAELQESGVYDTRFGRITVNPAQAIIFPTGLLGMPDRQRYCLSHFPSDKMGRFKVLQSLEDVALSFIALPVDIQNPIIEQQDLLQAARDVEMPIEDLAVLLLVTVHRDTGVARLTVNARAPVLMNTKRRLAVQFVFSNTKYQIRQPLSM